MYPRILGQIRALVRRGEYVLNGRIVRRERDRIDRPKYVIEGTALDGRGVTAVAQPFQTRQLVLIITAYET